MIHYDDYNLQLIERAIHRCYVRKESDDTFLYKA